MAFDEEGRKIQKAGEGAFVPRRLEGVSEEELDQYVTDLKAEIERVETWRGKQQSARAAADAVFKS